MCSESGDEADDEKEREKTAENTDSNSTALTALSVETSAPTPATEPVSVPSHYVKTLRLTSEEIVSYLYLWYISLCSYDKSSIPDKNALVVPLCIWRQYGTGIACKILASLCLTFSDDAHSRMQYLLSPHSSLCDCES